jgi:serine/threonine protein kinase
MEFRILGPLEVSAGDGALKVGGPKQRAVLAHLILRANRRVPADLLIDGLWGEEPPETAKNTLQTYVYRLRQLLGEDRIGTGVGGYVLRAEPEEIDAARFEAMVRAGKAQLQTDPSKAAAALSEALTLWRGSPLSDLSDEPSLRGEIARLEELHLSATEHRIAAEIEMGGHSTVVSELEALTASYPLRERMWANLMLALYRFGRQAEALAAYQRAREVLADELGAEPSQELQRLHEQILRHDPSLGRQETPRRTIKPSRVDLQPGTEFAGYRIVSALGRGGMAVVYLAEHDFLQRKVALKVLAPQLAEDERFRERFVRESRLAASLDHPNVVPIYEAGASGGDLFIAMRYVEGTDLRTLLAETGALDPSRAVSITRQVAAALDAAHEQGLVHRDVKPGNVLVARTRGSEAEHVYLSDFGLTKRSTSESGVTGTGQFVGTLDYAAPEQFRGRAADARTDVYSLGCVLFECLTGRAPFHAENDAGLMYAHLQEQPSAVSAERPELPKEIDAVIAKAMAKSPADRQPSAGALADEAARALHVGVPSGADAGKPASPLRRLLPIVAVAAALIIGIVVTSRVQSDTPEAVAGETGRASPTVTPSPTVAPAFRTVDRPLAGDEERLLAAIPDVVATNCSPLDQAQPAPEELAALVCRSAEVEVLYELFSTRVAMDAMFQGSSNRTQAPDGECATDELARTRYSIGGQPNGQVLCYIVKAGLQRSTAGEPARSHIEWTDENALIYAHAVRNDLGDLSLYEWWLTSSGPVFPVEGGGTEVTKDRPSASSLSVPPDGAYLAATGPCAPDRNGTCVMHIDGSAYDIRNAGAGGPFISGDILLQKPASVVFDPRSGFCFDRGHSTMPVTNTWSSVGDEVTFERTGGGNCGSPSFTEPWTRAPAGEIAIEQGGEIELIDPGGSVVRSTTQEGTRPNSWPDWSPDGSRIVFSGADEQGFDLYVMNADGTGITRLTNSLEDEVTPAWSPDGSKIAFAFDDQGEDHFRSGIAVVRPDGTGRTEIVGISDRSADSPAWSPDGSQIAYSVFTDGVPKPYVIDESGGEPVSLLDAPGFAQTWTPDGDLVMIAAFNSIVTVQPDGMYDGVFMKYPPERGRLDLDWSPDGSWIVASSAPDTSNTLYLIRSDGSEAFQVGNGTNPSWRPEEP